MTNFGELLQLKWNDHSTSIVQAFIQNLMNEQLVDVTMSCQGQLIKVHKLVLSAASPYFEMLFRLHQQKDIVIIINSISAYQLRLIVEYIYTGEIKIMEHELVDFLQAAEQLQIKSLFDVLRKKTKQEHLSSKNCDTHKYSDGNLTDEKNAAVYDNVDKKTVSSTNNPQQSISKNPSKLETSTNFRKNFATESEEKLITQKSLEMLTNEAVEELKDINVNTHKKIVSKKQIPRIRRPPNAFMVFANQWRKKIATEHSGDNNKEISVRLGQIWRNLEVDEKAQYFEESRRVDEEHRLKYPEYHYSPHKARNKKRKSPVANTRKKKFTSEQGSSEELVVPDKIIKTDLEQYESSESTDDPKYDSTLEYKPELSDVINAVIGTGVSNCIIENNNIVTKAEIEQNVVMKLDS